MIYYLRFIINHYVHCYITIKKTELTKLYLNKKSKICGCSLNIDNKLYSVRV
jgi:hypothetical protein